jgi:hypothetical protein
VGSNTTGHNNPPTLGHMSVKLLVLLAVLGASETSPRPAAEAKEAGQPSSRSCSSPARSDVRAMMVMMMMMKTVFLRKRRRAGGRRRGGTRRDG